MKHLRFFVLNIRMNFKELYTLVSEKRVIDGKQEYVPIKLPYSYDGLEPHIDQETMKLHYNKHYKGYIKKLNNAVNTSVSLETLVRRSAKRSSKVRNNAGGAYNHQIWWQMMTDKPSQLDGALKEQIIKQYKTIDNFKQKFIDTALGQFGSGWCWLVVKNNRLKILTTSNQDNPIMFDDGEPILGVDLWEHSYYKKYGPDREKYIKNFLKVVNWQYCNSLYITATKES